MKLTTLFRLRKPDGTDPVNIEDFNDNFDVIDEELGKRLESTGAASDMTVAFEQASARTNLKTGEKISVSFGKIMKWFADLKTVAFSGSYNDLTSKPTIPSGAAASQAVANNCTTTAAGSVLDARQGKVLMDKANQLSSELGGCRFGYTEDGQPGYKKDGADTVYPFRSDVYYTDFSIPNGLTQKVISLSDIPGATEIIGAGAIDRIYTGWTGLSVSYTSTQATIWWKADTAAGIDAVNSNGNWKVRIWWW